LQRENIKTATEVLEVAAEVLIDTAIIHEGAFAVTLARRISMLLSEKKISTDSALWKHAVEDILVRATVASLEAHAAVLRLLLDAASSLSAESLASAVEATLVNTKKSRKQQKKRAKRIVYEYEPLSDDKHARNGSTNNFGDAANVDSIDGSGPVSLDAIRSTYLLFTTREAKKLNETTAPILFDYVNKRAKRDKDTKDGDDGAGAEGYFDDEGDDGGSLMEFGLARDAKSPSVIRDSPLMSPR
jgi:negative elongation factor B